MKTDIQKYVVECDTCQRQKFETVAPPGLLKPIHIPSQKWSEVLLWREIPMASGTTIDSLTPEINPFQYAIESKCLTLND